MSIININTQQEQPIRTHVEISIFFYSLDPLYNQLMSVKPAPQKQVSVKKETMAFHQVQMSTTIIWQWYRAKSIQMYNQITQFRQIQFLERTRYLLLPHIEND